MIVTFEEFNAKADVFNAKANMFNAKVDMYIAKAEPVDEGAVAAVDAESDDATVNRRV